MCIIYCILPVNKLEKRKYFSTLSQIFKNFQINLLKNICDWLKDGGMKVRQKPPLQTTYNMKL